MFMLSKSDYLYPTNYEVQISRVACLLGEIEGRQCESDWWKGYHPDVYGKVTNELGNSLIAQLCDLLQKESVTKYSLEMQLWWRDYQKADKERLDREIQERTAAAEKEAALAKLTPYERKLLGF